MKGFIIFISVFGFIIALVGCAVSARPVVLAAGRADYLFKPSTSTAPTNTLLRPTLVPTTESAVPSAAISNGLYAALSEEELATDIDQAVTQAVAATVAAFTSVNTAAMDRDISSIEYDTAIAAVNAANDAILAAESAMAAYGDIYGELSTQPQAELATIEQDLQALRTPLMSLYETLALVGFSAQPQMTLTTDTLQQIDGAAKQARAVVAAVQPKIQVWLTDVTANLDRRASSILATKPTSIADTAVGALQHTNRFLATARSILADQKVVPDELARAAIDSANAVASLNVVGGPELDKLAKSIVTMTNQLARGQLPQVQLTLSGY